VTLFRTTPLGVGSDGVESFSSYIVRLASVHGLSVNEFRAILLNRYLADPGCIDERVRSKYAIPNLANLVRPTDFSYQMVDLVEMATGERVLSLLTFHALGNEFGRQRAVFRQEIAWCPLCLSDQIDSGQALHLKLAWSIKEYSVCHIHGCLVVQQCPACNGDQNSLRMRRSFGECTRCGNSLVGRGVFTPEATQLRVYVQDLIGLIAGINENPGEKLSYHAAMRCLDGVYSEIRRREKALGLSEVVPQDELHSILYGTTELTLPVLRRLAYRLDLDLYQLLSGRLEPVTRPLDESWLMILPANLRPKPKRPRICRGLLLARLEAALQRSEAPLPLSAVARLAGTTTGAVEYRFPSFARQVKDSFRIFEGKRRQRQEEMGRMLVYEFLASANQVSRKAAQRYVAANSDLSKNKIRALVSKYVPPANQTLSISQCGNRR